VQELAEVLLGDGDLSEESDNDSEGGESEGGELIADDQEVEIMVHQYAIRRTQYAIRNTLLVRCPPPLYAPVRCEYVVP
jgi:hypothetical protein